MTTFDNKITKKTTTTCIVGRLKLQLARGNIVDKMIYKTMCLKSFVSDEQLRKCFSTFN